MAFTIRMGLPEMADFWNDLSARKLQGKLGRDEEKFFKKLVKTLSYLADNPRHNSLASGVTETAAQAWERRRLAGKRGRNGRKFSRRRDASAPSPSLRRGSLIHTPWRRTKLMP